MNARSNYKRIFKKDNSDFSLFIYSGIITIYLKNFEKEVYENGFTFAEEECLNFGFKPGVG
jgi:hypothetical protein